MQGLREAMVTAFGTDSRWEERSWTLYIMDDINKIDSNLTCSNWLTE